MDDYCHCSKKSGQIPPFGNWDYAKDLPITQYFESARQAGLIRYTSSATGFHMPPHAAARPRPRSGATTDDARRQRRKKSSDVELRSRKIVDHQNGDVCRPRVKIVNIAPKPVDEDLYKIPPELLKASRKKKILRFFKGCLAPCSAA